MAKRTIEPYRDETLPERFLRWIETIRARFKAIPAYTESNGSPEGVIFGVKADRYFDLTGNQIYVKTTATGNTGWVVVDTGGALPEDLQTTYGASPSGLITLDDIIRGIIIQDNAVPLTTPAVLFGVNDDLGVSLFDVSTASSHVNLGRQSNRVGQVSSVHAWHDGTNVFNTLLAAAGGLEVNNLLTGLGLERVLTESDLATSGFQGLGQWRYRTATTPTPAAGRLQFDNVAPGLATELYVNVTNDNGIDMTAFLGLIEADDLIYIQISGDASQYIVIQTGLPVLAAGVYTFPIQLSEGVGGVIANNTPVAMVTTSAGGGGAGGTLPAGTVDDAILKWNTGTNTWIEETSVLAQGNGRMDLIGSPALLRLDAPGAAANETTTDIRMENFSGFVIQAITDGGSNSNFLLSANRTGLVWQNLQIQTNVDVFGNLIDLDNSANATASTIINRNSGGGITLNVNTTTGNCQLGQTSSAGAAEDVWIHMTRNGQVELRFNDVPKLLTNALGIAVRADINTATPPTTEPVQARTEYFDLDGSDSLGFVGYSGSNDLQLQNRMHDGEVILRGEDAPVGIQRIGGRFAFSIGSESYIAGYETIALKFHIGNAYALIGTKDSGLDLRFDNVGMARTVAIGSGGFEINNTVTGAGFERALTTSDLAGAAPVDSVFTRTGAVVALVGDYSAHYLVKTGGPQTCVSDVTIDGGGSLTVDDPVLNFRLRNSTDLLMYSAGNTENFRISQSASLVQFTGSGFAPPDHTLQIQNFVGLDINVQTYFQPPLTIGGNSNPGSGASWNAPHGAIPSAPLDGDYWTTTAGAFVRVNGVTHDLTAAGPAAPVTSVFGRTGIVVALQADYDGFFLTPAEGNLAYGTLAATNLNTAKVTNATHTGQVTGSGALVLTINAITDQAAAGALIGTDTFLVNDGGLLREITATQMDTFFGGGGGTIGGAITNDQIAFGAAVANDIEGSAVLTWNATTRTIHVGTSVLSGDIELHDEGQILIRNNGDGDSAVIRYTGSTFTIDADVATFVLSSTSDIRLVVDGGQPIEFADGTGSGDWVWDNATRLSFDQSLRVDDAKVIGWGNSVDFQIQFTGAVTLLSALGASNSVALRVNSTENALLANPNGSVVLYYNGSDSLGTQLRSTTGNTSSAYVYDHVSGTHDVGFNDQTPFVLTADTTLNDQHAGVTLVKTVATAGIDITCPTGAQFPTGSMVNLMNLGNSTVGVLTTGITLQWPDGSTVNTGSRTLAFGATVTIYRRAATTYVIMGSGIS